MSIEMILYTTIVLILIFSFTNGMKDGSNVAATVISSGSLSYKNAIIILVLAELAGPFLLGTMVAKTVAKNIINVQNIRITENRENQIFEKISKLEILKNKIESDTLNNEELEKLKNKKTYIINELNKILPEDKLWKRYILKKYNYRNNKNLLNQNKEIKKMEDDLVQRSLLLILSGVLGSVIWNFFTWFIGMPTSSSFSLVGGLIGPVIFQFGKTAVPWKIFLFKVIGAMFLSPLLGIIIGFYVYKFFVKLFEDSDLKVVSKIKKSQIFTLIFLGINHGTNDSQKAMGIIALLLFVTGKINQIGDFPVWVMLISIISLTFGITLGGKKIIKTVGYSIFKIRPLHSLSSHISSISILLFSNLAGAPVSTTQIISSSVIGVGSCYRKQAVKWQLFINILWSWILTIPLSGIVAGIVYFLLLKVVN